MSERFTFPPSWRWLDRPPLHLETGLRGHVVLVVHWRLGCAHSRAALHEAALLPGDLFGLPVAIVAVHVPTCDAERDDDRLRRTIAQMPGCMTHAVAASPETVERVPSMLLVDSSGAVRVRAPGVLRRNRVRAAMEQLCRESGRRAKRMEAPFVASPVTLPASWQPIAVVADGDRIWVASASHRSVFAFDADANVTMTVGSGQYGSHDGASDDASFALPAALCVHDEHLAVADTQNHTLRAIDRSSGEVLTWSGTGWFGVDDIGGGYGCDQALSSPAGIVSRDGGLFVCMAGTDQLWQVDPMTGSAMAWLGGDAIGYAAEERSQDTFAEPLGLAGDDERLWVAEGRGGVLSMVDLAHVQRHCVDEKVDAKFVRPVAVAVHEDRVFVADSWQASVFVVTSQGAEGARFLGPDDGLVEPVSLAIDGTRLFVADVGADSVFVCDLADSEPKLERWDVQGLPEPVRSSGQSGPTALVAKACQLREHSDVTLRLRTPSCEDGTKAVVDVVDEGHPILAADRHEVTVVKKGLVEVLLPVSDAGHGCLRLRLRLADVVTHYVVPVTVTATGELKATLVLPS